LLAGALQETTALAFPPCAETFEGDPGTVAGVAVTETVEELIEMIEKVKV
jgi:hypothetical protein